MVCLPSNKFPLPNLFCLRPPQDNPKIQMEADCLHDAEETDYNLMEKLIERRLRRNSHNLHASLEDLETKSIKDDTSSTSSSSSSSSESEAAAGSIDEREKVT